MIKFAPDGGDVVALAGVDVGGEQFDRLLFQAKVAPALHLNDIYEVRSWRSTRASPPVQEAHVDVQRPEELA